VVPLDTARRAGRITRPARERPGDDTMVADDVVLAGAGFSGPVRLVIEQPSGSIIDVCDPAP